MKYLFILMFLVSCTASTTENKIDPVSPSQQMWGYELYATTDDGVHFNGELVIQERMCENDFYALLADVKGDRFRNYKKVILDVYLDSLASETHWAFLRLKPKMKCNIYGMTIDQINELNNYSFQSDEADVIIGEWIIGTQIKTLYRKNNNLILLSKEFSGESLDELFLKEESGKLVDVDSEYFDEYFEILENGKLRCFMEDESGNVEFVDVEPLENFKRNNKYVPCEK